MLNVCLHTESRLNTSLQGQTWQDIVIGGDGEGSIIQIHYSIIILTSICVIVYFILTSLISKQHASGETELIC